MRSPTSFPEGTAERLKTLLKKAKSKSEFQRIQAVYLRVATTMSPDDIAMALAWHPGTVRNIHSAFLRFGEDAFRISSRGGRHRENLSISEEETLLEQFLDTANEGGVIVVSSIKAAYERKLGQKVPKSTIYRMLTRHDWRQIVPRPRHPKSDGIAQETFKKTSRKFSKGK